jgi:chemotaxis protein methyltransferase CheR
MPAPAPPPAVLAGLAELVEARAGLRFVDGRRAELATKATRAFVESNSLSWTDYCTRLGAPDGTPLLDHLLEALVVGETYFFRHRSYFDALEREVLPELIARRRETHQLRFWCAGCATGEEAYSLVIALRGLLPGVDRWQIRTLATDLSRAFLARAEEGVYGEWSFRETDEAFKAANFLREGRRFRLRPELRRLVRFRRHNLVEDNDLSLVDDTANLDLILCRNVLIYLAPEAARRVVARLWAALVPGGYLVLGPSDPLPGLLQGFQMRAGGDAILYRRAESDEFERPTRALDPLPGPGQTTITATPSRAGEPSARAPVATSAAREPPSEPHADDADWLVLWRAARAHADEGRLDEAIARCQEAISRAQHRAEPYYLLGALRQAQGADAAATVAWRQALYVDRGFVPAHLALAAVHRRAGRPDQARRMLVRGQRVLAGRAAEELVLPDEGMTVGRLRDALARALTGELAAKVP